MSEQAILADSFRSLSAGDTAGAERALAPLWGVANSRSARVLMLMGLIRNAQRRMREAERLLVEAAIAAPSDVQVLFNLGNFWLRAEKFDEAIDTLEKALTLAPDFSDARLGLAKALDLTGRHSEAEWTLTPLLGGERAHDAERLLSRVLANQGRYRDARNYVAMRIARTGSDQNTRFEHAFLLHKEHRYEDALAEYSALERDGVTSESLFAAKAAALIGARRVDEAMIVYRQGAERFPASVRLYTEWADARRLSGEDAESANGEFERAVATSPRNMGLRIAYAQSLLRALQPDRAVEVVRAGQVEGGEHPALHWMLGVCAAAVGNLGKAEQAYRRAASTAPTNGILKSLTHTLLRQGATQEALEIITPRMDLAPNDQEWIAYFWTALRIASDTRYAELADVDKFIEIIDLPAPASSGHWDGLVRSLDDIHSTNNGAFDQVNQAAIQVPRPLMDDINDELQQFFTSALSATREFVGGLPRSSSHPFLRRRRKDCRLAGAWTVRLIEGGSHSNHVHTLGWISSAFYAKVPARQEGDDPHAGWLTFGEPDAPMPGCGPLRLVEPKVGRLVLFPSYLWHGTIPFPRGERMTIAFDMLPYGL